MSSTPTFLFKDVIGFDFSLPYSMEVLESFIVWFLDVYQSGNGVPFQNSYIVFADILTTVSPGSYFDVLNDNTETLYDIIYLIFKSIWGEYYNSSIAFDSPTDFLQKFDNELANALWEYTPKIFQIFNSYQLTREELLQTSSSITNQSYNPNTPVEDVNKPINYISQQVYNRNTANPLLTLNEIIHNPVYFDIRELTDRFKWLFIKTFPCTYYEYRKDE